MKSILIRLVVMGVLSALLIWVGLASFKLFGLLLFVVLGALWALFFTVPLVGWLAGGISHGLSRFVFGTTDGGFETRPDFSLAEALVHRGKPAEAIEAYRDYALRFPKEIQPHVRIADLQMEHFQNARAAAAELRIALSKSNSPDSFSLLSHRLADLYEMHLGDARTALDCMQEIQRRHPGTPQARHATERAQRLLEEGEHTRLACSVGRLAQQSPSENRRGRRF